MNTIFDRFVHDHFGQHNKQKQMDVRIAMTQSRLEELFADPNIPPEFQPLIMMINAELEKMLQQI